MGARPGNRTTFGKIASACLAAALCAALILPGCAKKPKVDPFTEHWRVKAEKSPGYSPTAKPRKITFQETQIAPQSEIIEQKAPVKDLPKMPVSLKMYNTEVTSVLRALARAANVNVVLSSSIGAEPQTPVIPQNQPMPPQSGISIGQGYAGPVPVPAAAPEPEAQNTVNINIEKAPWDQAFVSILKANGLDYEWEGDIIRVYTLEDLERDNKMKEAREKNLVQESKIKLAEPYVTAYVEVKYADLTKIEFTLNRLCGLPGSYTQEDENKKESRDAEQYDPKTAGEFSGMLKGRVVADIHTNSLIIQAPRSDAEKMVKLIEQLDQPRPQIMLKAHIVEARKEALQELGIQWGGLLKGLTPNGNTFMLSPASSGATYTSNTFAVGDAVYANPYTGATTYYYPGSSSGPVSTYTLDPWASGATPYYGSGMSGTGFGINFPTASSMESALDVTNGGLGGSGMGLNFLFGTIGESVLETQLTALAEASKINIVASPSITTLENQVAYTENGKKVPYVSVSQNGTNVEWADAVMRLEMTPHIVDANSMRMKVKVVDDQVDENQANWVSGNPPIYKRQTETTLIVEDGDTIVISGLTRDVITTGSSGVPFLKDIPGLSWAFKSTSDSLEKMDVLIFITPHILNKKQVEFAPNPPSEDAPQKKTDKTGAGDSQEYLVNGVGPDGRPNDREY